MVEIESIRSLFLPAGRQGGRGQSPALSNGVNWIALIFMLICSVFIFVIFVSTFFSPEALKMRKSNYKKHELN